MLFSQKCRYALRAVVALAGRGAFPGGAGPVLVRDLAKKAHLPGPFLAKVIGDLRGGGIVVTTKGRGGGVLLARNPRKITLGDCVEAIDRVEGFRRCVLEDRPCREVTSCPLHRTCKKIREEILDRATIAQTLGAYQVCEEKGRRAEVRRRARAARPNRRGA